MIRPPMSEPMVVSVAPDGSPGASVARSTAHEGDGVLHLAVSIQVIDAVGGRWLLQRRSPGKALFPNRWSNTCCTHPAPGEAPRDAARRRVAEEAGLVVDGLVPAGSFTYRATDHESGLVEHEHDHVFVAFADTRGAEPDPAEISELALVPFEEALQIVQSGSGTPWAPYVLRRARAALAGSSVLGANGPTGRQGRRS